MEKLIAEQIDIFDQLKRLLANFKKSPKDRITVCYIEARQDIAISYYDSFQSQHKALVGKTGVPDQYHEIHDGFINVYLDCKTLFKEKLRELGSQGTQSPVKSHDSVVKAKLPPIPLPTFSGDYQQWISFRDLFTSLVIDNESISKVNKCQYLKTCLKGEAETLVTHFQVSEINFDIIWSTLTKRFNNERSIVNSYLNRFFHQRKLMSESARGIKELLDTTSECLVSLKHMGIPTDSWDVIVVHIIVSKLDSESHKLFEQSIGEDTTLPTWSKLSKFLEYRFRTLEIVRPKEVVKSKEFNQHTCTNNANTTHPKRVFSTQVASTSSRKACVFCEGEHWLCHCKQFCALELTARRDFVKTKGLCFNCLRVGHSAFKCLQSTFCKKCARKHHTLLHLQPVQAPAINHDPKSTQHNSADPQEEDTQQESTSHVVTLNQQIHSCPVLLATALINVYVNEELVTLRALIDPGSQASLITESACQQLKVKRNHIHSNIVGVDHSITTTKHSVVLKICSKHDSTYHLNVVAYVLKTLTTFLPGKDHHIDWPQLYKLQLADPTFQRPGRIDMILGADVYAHILQEGILKKDHRLIAQKTHLGWLVSGQPSTKNDTYNQISVHHIKLDVDKLLQRFWEVEEVDGRHPHRPLTKSEQQCEEYFSASHQRTSDGRYKVRLPFTSRPPNIGESRVLAIKRLQSLENKFKRHPALQTQYNEFMKDYLDRKHMESGDEKNGPTKGVCYLPHHAVICPQHITTKLRVVFDGSAKTSNGSSLNENLLIGPPLQNDIRDIMLRWRKHEVVLVGDIRQMYRQILVDERDSNYQRIVWRFSTNEPIQDYRLRTVTYGTACAPYLAIRVLKQLVLDEKDNFPEEIMDMVKEDFYVDDFLSGCTSEEKACTVKTNLVELLKRGGFQLHKWTSNAKTLRDDQTEENRKILGVSWNLDDDAFILKIDILQNNEEPTKRTILSDIAKIYDPAGWLSPVVIVAKITLQKLWLTKLEWDEPLNDDMRNEYNKFKCELIAMPMIKLERWIEQETCIGKYHKVELHGFSDASMVAYSAVIYYRSITATGVKVTILEAKTKVAPVKQLSLPRLELCGAVLLAQLLHKSRQSLNVPLDCTYAWTDSTIVLAWLQRHPNYWATFVANRVTEIINRIDKDRWHHVVSQDNPADVASRGISPSELRDHTLWWHGPQWLNDVQFVVPSDSYNDIPSTMLEGKIMVYTVTSENVKGSDNLLRVDILNRFSSLTKLIRVVAYCFRFMYICKMSLNKYAGLLDIKASYLTTAELHHALNVCIKMSQFNHFKEDICMIKDNKLTRKSRILNLNPYIDENDILRVGGRLSNSYLSEFKKHPIILANDYFAKLIVKDMHIRTLHGGVQLLLSCIRSKFWILKAKTLVKHCIHHCIKCYRQSAKPMTQLMGELPRARVTPSRPFAISGVDFAGPVTLKLYKGRGCKTQKAYIAVFICTSVKAVHLELVSSLDTDGFIAAFRRFTARRGHCHQLWSDCGTNFVGASKELKIMEKLSKTDLSDILENDGTTWCFNPPSAPHMGGLWESAVKSTKRHLNRVLGDSKLTYEEYETLLCQIEACLNSRPLTLDTSSDDPSEPTALTPGHFLIGETPIVVPDRHLEGCKVPYHERWMFLQQKLQEFWRRWNMEYLTNLQVRSKWNIVSKNLKIGDIVLVKDDRMPPTKWCLAKVIDVHSGPDGKIRVVSLKCKSTIIKRPIHKLCLLPIEG